MRDFGLSGFLWRWIPALILVCLTYNPLRWSYYHWVAAPGSEGLPLQVLAGIVLLIGYGIYLSATWKSIGPIGLIVVLLFFGVLLWVFYYYGWLRPDDPTEIAWIALIVLSLTLAIGMSWSAIWRRMTGQVSTDELGDDGVG